MLVEQRQWTPKNGWRLVRPAARSVSPQLVLVFGSVQALEDPALIADVLRQYPTAEAVGCSTAGEICDEWVFDHSLVTTAIEFAATDVRVACQPIPAIENSADAARALASTLLAPDLAHVLLFTEGLRCDSAAVLHGIHDVLPSHIGVTGGMAGDNAHFRHTVLLAHGEALPHRVVAVGLYGKALRVGHGTLGGWDPYGPSRVITRSRGNVAYEMDGERALDIYRRYLGEYGATLPGSALQFPLSMNDPMRSGEVVRTVCGIDEAEGSLTFAGDVPEGAQLRMMKANVERLIDAASAAATVSTARLGADAAELTLLVSCIGRKMLLGVHVDEEVECVRDIVGREGACVGFYSYGEIAPLASGTRCELHNQTLTVTTFAER